MDSGASKRVRTDWSRDGQRRRRAFPESRHPVSVSSSQVVYDALKANGIRLLLRTGWSRRTGAQEFLNVGPDGPHSPGFHKEATLFLIHERDVLGVGVKPVGTDAGQAGTFDPPSPITP